MRSSRWPAICAIAVSALLAAGCTGSAEATPDAAGKAAVTAGTATPSATPGTQALGQRAASAVRKASSVHITGSFRLRHQDLQADISLVRPDGAAGLIMAGSAPLTILATGGKIYLSISPSALRFMHLRAACGSFCGKWLLLPAATARSMRVTWSSFTQSLIRQLLAKGNRVTGTAKVAGQRAWAMRCRNGRTVYVAASGPAYPLRDVVPGRHAAHVDFTRWNHVTMPPAPPASEVVTLRQLGA